MKNLVKKGNTDLSAYGADFITPSNEGFEDTTKDSYVIPFIRIMQALSGALKKSSSYYISGAKEGQILNTLTRSLSDEIYIVPVHQENRYDLKKKVDNKTKFIGSFAPSDQRVMDAMQACGNDEYHCFDKESEGQFFLTSYVKVIHFEIIDGVAKRMIPSMISFSSYNLETGKNIMTQCKMSEGGDLPLYTNVVELSTTTTTKGSDEWSIFTSKYLGKIPQLDISNGVELFQKAKDFYGVSKNTNVNDLDHSGE